MSRGLFFFSGDRQQRSRQLGTLVDNCEQFRPFDRRELVLIEPQRKLRTRHRPSSHITLCFTQPGRSLLTPKPSLTMPHAIAGSAATPKPLLAPHPVGNETRRLACAVLAHGDDPHLSHIHTGLTLLAQSGLLSLRYAGGTSRWNDHVFSQRDVPRSGLYVLLNSELLIYYDLRDSADLDERALGMANVYFKRSYSPATIPMVHQHKVISLGLNYEVYANTPSWHDLKWLLGQRATSRPFMRATAQLLSRLTGYPLAFVPELGKMHAAPDPGAPPRALFMVRAWDPTQDPTLSAAEQEDRRAINEMRAACVRLLKKALGERFTGGFAHTSYALSHHKDVLLTNPALAHKNQYLQLLQAHPICIATTGLHASIGWKLAEYVAFSKAIVSEKLNFLPPDGFTDGTHYLSFSTPEACVKATQLLMSNAALRSSLMSNNQAYYRQHLAPDALVWRSLLKAKNLSDTSR